MPLHLYGNVYDSGTVPADWMPSKGGALRYPVRNPDVLLHLRSLASGKWRKIIKFGNTGEIHYFEHESGQVAGVKFYPK